MNEGVERKAFWAVFLIGLVIVIAIFFATGVINIDIGCDNCGTWLRTDDKFCRKCGTPAYEYRPSCNGVIEDNEKFCAKCGMLVEINEGETE